MRHRFLTRYASLIAGIMFVALAGCSDDKTTNTSETGGITVNEDQSMMQQDVNATSDSLVTFLADAFESRAALGVGSDIDPVYYTPIDNDSDIVVTNYDSETGWHDVLITRLALAYNVSRRDSIQFRNSNGIPQRQGGSASSMTYHHRFDRESIDTTSSYYNRSGVWQYELTGLQTDQATITGTTQIMTEIKTTDESDTSTWRSYDFDATVSNMVVNRTGGAWSVICPSSGTISGTMTTSFKRGDAPAVTRHWDVNIEFNDGTAHITVSLGRNEWESNQSVCTVAN